MRSVTVHTQYVYTFRAVTFFQRSWTACNDCRNRLIHKLDPIPPLPVKHQTREPIQFADGKPFPFPVPIRPFSTLINLATIATYLLLLFPSESSARQISLQRLTWALSVWHAEWVNGTQSRASMQGATTPIPLCTYYVSVKVQSASSCSTLQDHIKRTCECLTLTGILT